MDSIAVTYFVDNWDDDSFFYRIKTYFEDDNNIALACAEHYFANVTDRSPWMWPIDFTVHFPDNRVQRFTIGVRKTVSFTIIKTKVVLALIK